MRGARLDTWTSTVVAPAGSGQAAQRYIGVPEAALVRHWSERRSRRVSWAGSDVVSTSRGVQYSPSAATASTGLPPGGVGGSRDQPTTKPSLTRSCSRSATAEVTAFEGAGMVSEPSGFGGDARSIPGLPGVTGLSAAPEDDGGVLAVGGATGA